MAKNLILWLIIAAVLVTVMNNFSSPSEPQTLNYSDFIQQVKDGKVERVTVDGYVITGKRSDGDTFKTIRPAIQDNGLIGDLVNNNVVVEGKQPEQQSIWTQLLVASFPILVIIAVFMFFMRQMQGGGGGRGGPMSFGKSKARLLSEDQVKTTFADVAGCDEAKEEVSELVEFLRDPGKFQRLGGRIPRGVLMVGPPGTGKTLLAKAIAGEAKVPFFTISGSDFVEMFVGVGASRVRDMFDQAKKHAPCIIFIDEIDAVGRHRGAGGRRSRRARADPQPVAGGDGWLRDERWHHRHRCHQPSGRSGPGAAASGPLRPPGGGRLAGYPRARTDPQGAHAQGAAGRPCRSCRHRPRYARFLRRRPGQPGQRGLAVRRALNKRIVDMREFELAKDKIMMGAERKTMVMSEKEKRNTAYHEAGHAIVGRLVPEHDPVYKVSIIPRGRALGVTMFLPEEDRYSLSKRALESQICSLFGGRIAEEMTLGFEGVTTGASNDIMRATQLARNMVTKWGLSEKLGPLMYAEEEGEVFLGRSAGSQHANVSGETAKMIDQEVRRIIDDCYGTAKRLLDENRDKLEMMADALMKYETIDSDQIDDIMAGRVPREPRDWQGGSGTGTPPANLEESGRRENTLPSVGRPASTESPE